MIAELDEPRMPGAVRLPVTGVILFLATIQAVRMALSAALYAWARPPMPSAGATLIGAATFAAIGAPLLWWALRCRCDLGLTWRGLPRTHRVAYALGGVILAGLLATALTIDPSPAAVTQQLYSVLLVPACEELLFRGYAWGKIGPALRGRYAGLAAWLIVSILFALWHVGYVDSLLRAVSAVPLVILLFFKALTGLVVGLLAGAVRWRTGSVYGAFLAHALFNLFGR